MSLTFTGLAILGLCGLWVGGVHEHQTRSAPMAPTVSHMFEVFDLPTRAAATRADEEARGHSSHCVGTEHVFLECLAANAIVQSSKPFEVFDVTVAVVRSRVEDSIGPASLPQSGHLSFSRRATLVLERTRTWSALAAPTAQRSVSSPYSQHGFQSCRPRQKTRGLDPREQCQRAVTGHGSFSAKEKDEI